MTKQQNIYQENSDLIRAIISASKLDAALSTDIASIVDQLRFNLNQQYPDIIHDVREHERASFGISARINVSFKSDGTKDIKVAVNYSPEKMQSGTCGSIENPGQTRML
jgi:actin-like ATPase involved in cell morphogenesis